MSNFSRRKFLQATASGAAVAVAGCQSDMTKEDAMSASDIFSNIEIREGEQGDFKTAYFLQVTLADDPHAYYDVCTFDPALGMTTCNSHRAEITTEEITLLLPNETTVTPTPSDSDSIEWLLQDDDTRLQTGEYVIQTPVPGRGTATLSFDMAGGPTIEESTLDVSETV